MLIYLKLTTSSRHTVVMITALKGHTIINISTTIKDDTPTSTHIKTTVDNTVNGS